MARQLRISGEGAVHHITSKCNNEEFLLNAEKEFNKYLEIIGDCKKRYNFKLYHYALLNNHIHLLLQTGEKGSVSEILKYINGVYAGWYNRVKDRKGHLWQDRFGSKIIEAENYFLRCAIYIELNPVRAGLVKNPLDWKFSSARASIEGENDKIIDVSDVYLSLGCDTKERQFEYKALLKFELERTNALNEAIRENNKEMARKILRMGQPDFIPYKKKLTKFFGYSLTRVLNIHKSA